MIKIIKKWQAGSLLVLILFLFSFFQNCSEYRAYKSNNRTSSSRGPACKSQPTVPTPFEENKIQINTSFLEDEEQDDSGRVQQKLTTTETEKKLSILVDPLCLSQEDNFVQVLGQTIEVPPELSSLNRVAISLTVHGSIDMEQLTQGYGAALSYRYQ